MITLKKKEELLKKAKENRKKKTNETFEMKNKKKSYEVLFNSNIYNDLKFDEGDKK